MIQDDFKAIFSIIMPFYVEFYRNCQRMKFFGIFWAELAACCLGPKTFREKSARKFKRDKEAINSTHFLSLKRRKCNLKLNNWQFPKEFIRSFSLVSFLNTIWYSTKLLGFCGFQAAVFHAKLGLNWKLGRIIIIEITRGAVIMNGKVDEILHSIIWWSCRNVEFLTDVFDPSLPCSVNFVPFLQPMRQWNCKKSTSNWT